MVDAAVTGAAVTFLLEQVTQLLKSYVELISGAENELEQLKQDLELLDAFLEGADDMPNKDPTIMVLERQIREVVHDAEDTIDKCLISLRLEPAKASRPKRFGIFCRCHETVSLAKEVKSARDKVKPKLEEARAYNPRMGGGSRKGGEVQKVPFSVEDKIIGFEDQEEAIVKRLKEEKEKLNVISITGMAGLGKTAVARKVYESGKIQNKSRVPIWVNVSQDFNPRDVFLEILKRFTNDKMVSGSSDDDLIQTVSGYLSQNEFFLVIDDVWKTEVWDEIKRVLPKNNGTSKVLITSRHFDVGKHASGKDPHELRFLKDKESWEILQSRVFEKVGDCPPELQEIGKAIAKQCQKLPLSLVVIGGILLKEYSPSRAKAEIYSAWEKVSENVNEHVRNDQQNRPTIIVELSYKHLPRNLRNCFLYLGVFPEDYEIPVWTLTRLWIAEGFVQLKDGQQSLEEIAEENLKDLINRSLVMAVKRSPTGEVKTCRVHDVIHAFCKTKASIQHQNLFLHIHKSNGVFQPPATDIGKCRRLCIHSDVNDFLEELQIENLKAPRVRSLLCFCKDRNVEFHPKYLSTISDAFKLLRVLDSKSMKFIQFPPNITRLIHLRYIALSAKNLSILPSDLSFLWNLQTLVVDTKSRTLEIRANIWKMIQLRHLKTKAEIILAVQEEGRGGKNLQTLSRLSPTCCIPNVFRKACNLKRLGIRGDLAILLENGTSFQNLDSVETLKLKHDLPYYVTSSKPLRGLPPPNCFSRHVKRLTLSATCLEWNAHMSTLAMIGTLEVLKLKEKAFMGMSWNVGAAFPRLRFLLIEKTNLVIWEASNSNDHFPNLWCLVLKNCDRLGKIPVGLSKSLEELKMDTVPQSAVDSAQKIKEARLGGIKLDIGVVLD